MLMLETPLLPSEHSAYDIEALNTRTVGREGLVIGTDAPPMVTWAAQVRGEA